MGPERVCITMTTPKRFTIEGSKTAIGPIAIRFEPVRRSRRVAYAAYRAIAIRLNGKESRATSAEISQVAGHQFFDSDTGAIGAKRLRAWLSRRFSDEQMANDWDDTFPIYQGSIKHESTNQT